MKQKVSRCHLTGASVSRFLVPLKERFLSLLHSLPMPVTCEEGSGERRKKEKEPGMSPDINLGRIFIVGKKVKGQKVQRRGKESHHFSVSYHLHWDPASQSFLPTVPLHSLSSAS